tara:strand:+ start:429 stop:626 length:198 start_codon:yes stop_codon:yes gene_type:complete
MSLLDFYSELFPGNLLTWMIGGTVLLAIIILVETFFDKYSKFVKLILIILFWLLSPAVIWIAGIS